MFGKQKLCKTLQKTVKTKVGHRVTKIWSCDFASFCPPLKPPQNWSSTKSNQIGVRSLPILLLPSSPKHGRSICTSVLSAFRLLRWSCIERLQYSVGTFSLMFYQHYGSQKRSAMSGSKIPSVHFHHCFISIPAPSDDLQCVAAKLGLFIFTSVLRAFQLPYWICLF